MKQGQSEAALAPVDMDLEVEAVLPPVEDVKSSSTTFVKSALFYVSLGYYNNLGGASCHITLAGKISRTYSVKPVRTFKYYPS